MNKDTALDELLAKYENLSNLKEYVNFIQQCINKNYTGDKTHKHHILPKFMGGTNSSNNLLIMSYEDHLNAHLILAECFQENTKEYKGNIVSANHIKNWVDSPVDLKEKLSKICTMSFKGNKHTKSSIDKIINSKKGKSRPREVIEAMNRATRGKKLSEERKLDIGRKIKKLFDEGKLVTSPNFKPTKEYLSQLSDKMKNCQNGKYNTSAKKILHVESGVVFDCLKDAMTEFGYTNYNILNRRIRSGVFILVENV